MVASAIASFLCMCLAFGAIALRHFDRHRFDRHREVLAMVEAGTLIPAPNGAISLPPVAAELAMSGTAYVSNPRPGQTLVLFPQTHWGSSSYWLGHLVTSQPLQAGDAIQNWPGGVSGMLDAQLEPCVYQFSNLK